MQDIDFERGIDPNSTRWNGIGTKCYCNMWRRVGSMMSDSIHQIKKHEIKVK